jgi:hypothetical protein
VDTLLLERLRHELMLPEVVRYITNELAKALNQLLNERPARQAEVRQARDQAAQRLRRLITAIEDGVAPQTLAVSIQERQAEVSRLDAQVQAFAEPLPPRLAITPVWVERQLADVVSVLQESSERAKLELRRLGLRVVMQPIRDEQPLPFLRAVANCSWPVLAGTTDFSRQPVDRFLPEAAGSLPWGFTVDFPANQPRPWLRKHA